jgi:acyl carrier protein
MAERHIEALLQDYINDRILGGQAADLTPATPLFEYGILDSFALFTLLTFITDTFEIPMQLEQLRKEDFETIATIADFVRAKLAMRSLEA